jgi:dipeptidyl aminopeptidase/acylaminoacyl peptidase
VLAGVDHAVAMGIADPERLGVGGWSYGAILTNAVIATDARFKAAISGAGASNMYGMYGHDQYIREYELELGTPWDHRAVYDRASFPFLTPNGSRRRRCSSAARKTSTCRASAASKM